MTTDERRLGLTRVRLGALAVAYAILGAACGAIFDELTWTLVAAACVPTLAAMVVCGRSAPVRAVFAVVVILGVTAFAVRAADGTITDLVDAFVSGPRRLLSTDWPSPARGDLVGTVAAALATGSALSAEIARRPRWHLLPLLPLVVLYVMMVAASAPAGAALAWLGAIAIPSVIFAALRNDGSVSERWHLLLGERRLVPLILIATAIAALVSVPVALATRSDPRSNDRPELTAALLDPIEATVVLRSLDPPIDLHEIEMADGSEPPSRWRTAALEVYDGRRWSPSITLRPIGRRLGEATDGAMDLRLSFLDDDLRLVPLPGSPVTVDAPIETDPLRTIVRLSERPELGASIDVTSNTSPTRLEATQIGLATRAIDENVSGLTGLAESLGGEGTIVEQLSRIESTMRDDFELDPTAPGGGLQRVLIERFLRETQRGNAEQFTAAFVLLARSLGVDARVATGFEAPADSTGQLLTLTSSDAAIWPEVRLVDGRWTAFDPTPEEEVTDASPPPPEPQVQSPAAPQPPIAPPPDPDTETPQPDAVETTDLTVGLSDVAIWLTRIGLAVGFVLIPILAAAALVVGLKIRRRRRRLRSGSPSDQIRGAWATATDSLVDAGLMIRPSETDVEIATNGEPLAPSAERELHRLATLSRSATFGDPARPDLLVHDASVCLEQVERSIAAERSMLRRVRWRLSLRSFRSRTRSPVTA